MLNGEVETGGQKARRIVREAWPDMDDRSKKPATPQQVLIINDLGRNIKGNRPVTSQLH